jgi:hypothetical protein
MFEELNNAYERCLVFMHKMPRMWIDYLSLLVQQCKITKTRHTFDRALKVCARRFLVFMPVDMACFSFCMFRVVADVSPFVPSTCGGQSLAPRVTV